MRARSGRIKRKYDGSIVTRKAPCAKGRLDPSFCRKHKLTSSSHPHEFVQAFIPFQKNIVVEKGTKNEMLSFDLLSRWTNLKGVLANDPTITPPSRDKYPNWKVRPLIKWINHIGPEA
eukprot:13624034-Ditylum_brightwellii.AAC.1